MERDSPNVFAVLNMKREQQQEKSFLLAVLEVFCFFHLFWGFCPAFTPFLSIPYAPPSLGSHVQQLDHVAIICFCISLTWVAGIGAGSHF